MWLLIYLFVKYIIILYFDFLLRPCTSKRVWRTSDGMPQFEEPCPTPCYGETCIFKERVVIINQIFFFDFKFLNVFTGFISDENFLGRQTKFSGRQ